MKIKKDDTMNKNEQLMWLKQNYYVFAINHCIFSSNKEAIKEKFIPSPITETELTMLSGAIQLYAGYSNLDPQIKDRIQTLLNNLRFDETLELSIDKNTFWSFINDLIIKINQIGDKDFIDTIATHLAIRSLTKKDIELVVKKDLYNAIASDYQVYLSLFKTENEFIKDSMKNLELNPNFLGTVNYIYTVIPSILEIEQVKTRLLYTLLHNQEREQESNLESSFFKKNKKLIYALKKI